MSAWKGARQLSLAVEEEMMLDCARAPKGRPSTMSPVEFRDFFWLEFENDIIYDMTIGHSGRTREFIHTPIQITHQQR